MKRPYRMHRSKFKTQFASVLICASLALSATSLNAEKIVIQQSPNQNRGIVLHPATDKAILEFPQSLSNQKTKNDAVDLAKSMGFTTEGKRLAPNELIVDASLEALEKAVKALPQDKSAGLITKSLYYINGIPNDKTRVSFKSRVIVSYKSGTSLDDRIAIETQFSLTNPKTISSEMVGYDVALPSNEVAELASKIWSTHQANVSFAEPVFTRHNELMRTTALSPGELGDPLLKKQWHHDNDGTEENRGGLFDTDLDTPRSWNPNTRNTFGGDTTRLNAAPVRTTTGYYGAPSFPDDFDGAVLTVAVFDSGTDIEHEDWNRNITDNDPDPGGFSVIDPRLGFDYLSGEFNPDPNGSDNHGTSVAGIIAAARNNGVGVSGIAPDVRLLSYRLVEDGASASNEDFAAAIIDAGITKQADIGNHSYGGIFPSPSEQQAYQTVFINGRFGKGMVNFASAGNDFTYMSYPALYDTTFAVGAMDRDGFKSGYGSFGGRLDFTGFGDQLLDGDGVLTLDLSGTAGETRPDPSNTDDPFGNYYDDFNGTSAASPTVAGVAALILAESPGFDAVQLFNVMANTADRIGDPFEYTGIFNNATRFQTRTVSFGEDGFTSSTEIFRAGATNGFRKDFTRLGVSYAADGFSPFYGYGRPNPYRALTTQFAESPIRDYIDDIPKSDEDPEATLWDPVDQPAVDLGEVKLRWVSDFTSDFYNLFQTYLSSLEDPAADDALELAAELTREDPEGLGNWDFFQSRRVVLDDDEDISPLEIGYELTSEIYDELLFVYDFFGNPTSPVPPNDFTFAIQGIVEVEKFPVLLSMVRPTRAEESTSFVMPEAGSDTEFYNPRGRYLPDTEYIITSRNNIVITEPDTSVPMFMDITIRHEMGIEDASTAVVVTNEDFFGVNQEFEIIEILYNGSVIGRIYGDSDDSVVFPLVPATALERIEDDPNSEIRIAKWDPLVFDYRPEKGLENLPFRTYRFTIPPSLRSNLSDVTDEDGSILLDESGEPIKAETPIVSIRVVNTPFFSGVAQGSFALGTGDSYLPEYDITGDDPSFEELFLQNFEFRNPGFPRYFPAQRDAPGYEIAQIKLYELDNEPDPITNLTAKDIYNPDGKLISARGALPVWTKASNELLFTSNTASATGIDEIRTALSDSFTRQLVGNTPSVVRRNSTRLLRTIPAEGNPQGTNPSITALATDGNSSLMAYIIDDAFALNHVFIATQDGFDERPLFPATNGVSRDTQYTDISLSPFSDEILLTTETSVVSTDPEGTFAEVILSTQGTKLRDFQDIVPIANDSAFVFSAVTTQGDRGIFLAAKNISTPGAPNLLLTLADFPNSDEFHPTVSPNGRYLIFASNSVDQEAGTPPTASSLPRLYFVSDLRNLIQYGSELSITGPLNLARDQRLGSTTATYPGARNPQFEFTNTAIGSNLKIAFEGIDSASQPIGEIAVSTLAQIANNNFPLRNRFDAPLVNPFPVEEEVVDGLLSQISRTDFNTKGDGWKIVVNSTDSFEDPLTSRQGGALTLLSSGNSNTYGFFESPKQYLRTISPAFTLSNLDEFNHYLVRYYVRRTSPNAAQAPIFRGSVVSTDGQDTHVINVTPSVDANNPYTPELSTFSEVDLLFQPNPMRYRAADFNRYYTVTFELLNNTPGSDPLGGYVLDRVDIFRLEENAVEEVGNIETFEFNSQSERDMWSSTSSGSLPAPIFSSNNDSLSISVNNTTNTNAAWSSDADAVEVNPVGVEGDLYVRMRTDVTAAQTTVAALPVIELTLQDAEGKLSATHRINAVAGTSTPNSIAPTTGNERRYYVYWRLAPELQDAIQDLTATFRVISNNRPGVSNGAVSLQNAEFDLIRIDGYPEVDPIYE